MRSTHRPTSAARRWRGHARAAPGVPRKGEDQWSRRGRGGRRGGGPRLCPRAAQRGVRRAVPDARAHGAAQLQREDRGRPLRDLDRHADADERSSRCRKAPRNPARERHHPHDVPGRRVRSPRKPELRLRGRGGGGGEGRGRAGEGGVDTRGRHLRWLLSPVRRASHRRGRERRRHTGGVEARRSGAVDHGQHPHSRARSRTASIRRRWKASSTRRTW